MYVHSIPKIQDGTEPYLGGINSYKTYAIKIHGVQKEWAHDPIRARAMGKDLTLEQSYFGNIGISQKVDGVICPTTTPDVSGFLSSINPFGADDVATFYLRRVTAPPTDDGNAGWDASTFRTEQWGLRQPKFYRFYYGDNVVPPQQVEGPDPYDAMGIPYVFDISSLDIPSWACPIKPKWLSSFESSYTWGPTLPTNSFYRRNLWTDVTPTDTRLVKYENFLHKNKIERYASGPRDNPMINLDQGSTTIKNRFMDKNCNVYRWADAALGYGGIDFRDVVFGPLWFGPSVLQYHVNSYANHLEMPMEDDDGSLKDATVKCWGIQEDGDLVLLQTFSVPWTKGSEIELYGYPYYTIKIETTLTYSGSIPYNVFGLLWTQEGMGGIFNHYVPYIPNVPLTATSGHLTSGDCAPFGYLMKLNT